MRFLLLVSMLILGQSVFAVDWVKINGSADIMPFEGMIVALDYIDTREYPEPIINTTRFAMVWHGPHYNWQLRDLLGTRYHIQLTDRVEDGVANLRARHPTIAELQRVRAELDIQIMCQEFRLAVTRRLAQQLHPDWEQQTNTYHAEHPTLTRDQAVLNTAYGLDVQELFRVHLTRNPGTTTAEQLLGEWTRINRNVDGAPFFDQVVAFTIDFHEEERPEVRYGLIQNSLHNNGGVLYADGYHNFEVTMHGRPLDRITDARPPFILRMRTLTLEEAQRLLANNLTHVSGAFDPLVRTQLWEQIRRYNQEAPRIVEPSINATQEGPTPDQWPSLLLYGVAGMNMDVSTH